jgi:hypothetical protein
MTALLRRELPHFRRDLRWIVPTWAVLALAVGVWMYTRDGAGRAVLAAIAVLGLGVALSPIFWLQYRWNMLDREETGRRLKAFGLALLWCVAVSLLLAAALTPFDGGF